MQKNNGKNTAIKIGKAVGAVAAAAVLFFAGFFTYYFTLPEGARSLLWMKGKIDSEYQEDVDDEDFWQAAIDGAESLLDRYSTYYTAKEYDTVVNASKGISSGTGISFFSNTNKIVSVAFNSPAFYANAPGLSVRLETGAYVTGAGTSPETVRDTFRAVSAGGETAYDYGVLDEVMQGFKEGDTAYLRISATSGSDTQHCEIVPVTLETYTESYVLYAADGKAWTTAYDGKSAVWTDVSEYVSADEQADGAAYIRLSRFYGNAAEEFGLAVRQYKEDGMNKLVLDLRNDGGGSVSVMQGIASYLMKDAQSGSAPVMTAKYKDGKQEVYSAKGNVYGEYFDGCEIFVAANKNTASASEALIGVMISYHTIGYENIFITDTDPESDAPVTTYGKGIMQTTFKNYWTGEAIKLTTATIYWPDGTCIHGKGISSADGAKASPAETFGEYGDAELDFIFGEIAK